MNQSNGNGANNHHLDAIDATGCKIGIETTAAAISSSPTKPDPVTDLGRDICKMQARVTGLSDFEVRHRKFIGECGSDCFLNGDCVSFLAGQREKVRDYFGSEGWQLMPGPAASKVVEGITVRLVLDPEDFGVAEISL